MMGRVDPIVSPGAPSGHVHAVQGGNAFGLTLTDDQLLSSTVCAISFHRPSSAFYQDCKTPLR